ncbi:MULTISPECIES: hypothetical protein [Cyanophyceae]|uniref:hypothetical protein n=1 Tax=Cyanophyceae TaxID=3028117 RepID=UPI00168240D3|nr:MULTISPECIES: hypothetical protein [Cyanophyceae]MBD1917182.1 hypothetical protein [Phormidium sp. FACHB-77]MBD2030713.1 hypothetical protein [Phormidium sp. FACHB-322]MBD2050179.1 hypothetical protein [Leptolyngbya sp. FACHB-60]
MFTTIWLETQDGHVVRKADLPKFPQGQEPEVILWGNRVFVQQEMMEVYREVTFYPLIDRPEQDFPL